MADSLPNSAWNRVPWRVFLRRILVYLVILLVFLVIMLLHALYWRVRDPDLWQLFFHLFVFKFVESMSLREKTLAACVSLVIVIGVFALMELRKPVVDLLGVMSFGSLVLLDIFVGVMTAYQLRRLKTRREARTASSNVARTAPDAKGN